MTVTQIGNKSSERLLQNVHPNVDLARAANRLFELKKEAGNKAKFDRKELTEYLHLGVGSGAANAIISAFMYFGLMQRFETDYLYTELGSKLLASKPGSREYTESLQEALRGPELYGWLHEKYQQLPDEIDDILVGKYHDRGVKKENVKTVLNNYLKSVKFVEKSSISQGGDREADEYVSVSFRGNTVPIYAKYLIEAIKKTREDELIKVNESLKTD